MDIESNLAQIQRNIQESCSHAARDPSEVLLLPVSKGHSADVIRAAADLGLNVFAENKIQEAKIKISQCPGRLRWHMIGHLQSNKCRDAVHFFEMIQSVDSVELAVEINKTAEKAAKYIPTLLEVNDAGEATKFGLKPEHVLDSLQSLNSLSRLRIHA